MARNRKPNRQKKKPRNRPSQVHLSDSETDILVEVASKINKSEPTKKPQKKLISFYMDEDYYEKLQEYADESRVTRSQLMRQILIDFIRNEERSQGKLY